MKCPYCKSVTDKVIDSRLASDSLAIRRRRECLECSRRFTTYERIEEVPFMVIKKDGRRELFQREKLLGGIRRACEKRPVAAGKVEELTDGIEREIKEKFYDEVPSEKIGKLVMESVMK